MHPDDVEVISSRIPNTEIKRSVSVLGFISRMSKENHVSQSFQSY